MAVYYIYLRIVIAALLIGFLCNFKEFYVLTDNQIILISDIHICVCVYIYVVYIVMLYVVYIENWKISKCVYKNMYVHNM